MGISLEFLGINENFDFPLLEINMILNSYIIEDYSLLTRNDNKFYLTTLKYEILQSHYERIYFIKP